MKPYILPLLLAAVLQAQPKKQEKRSAAAHEHGAGKLDIAMDGLRGTFVFEIPMESVTGFEHEPKTAADKQKALNAEKEMRAQIGRMILPPAEVGCSLAVYRVQTERHGNHSEMHVQGEIVCKKPLAGEVRFAFGKVFPGIHKVVVQFAGESGQAGAIIEHDRGVLTIGSAQPRRYGPKRARNSPDGRAEASPLCARLLENSRLL